MANLEWKGKTLATFGDISSAVSAILLLPDPEERQRTADAFMDAYRATSEHADANVGYLCGYFGHDTMVEMLRLFRTEHPIFGSADQAEEATPDSAFAAGQAFGERSARANGTDEPEQGPVQGRGDRPALPAQARPDGRRGYAVGDAADDAERRAEREREEPRWEPDWELELAPKGDDEAEVEALYRANLAEGVVPKPWDSLEEWQRESWRREYRDA